VAGKLTTAAATTKVAPSTTTTTPVRFEWSKVCTFDVLTTLYVNSARSLVTVAIPEESTLQQTTTGTILKRLKHEGLFFVRTQDGRDVLVKPEDVKKAPPPPTMAPTTTTPPDSSMTWWIVGALCLAVMAIVGILCCLNSGEKKKKKAKKTRALPPNKEVEPVEPPKAEPTQSAAQWMAAPVLAVQAPPPVTTHVVPVAQVVQPQVFQYAAPVQPVVQAAPVTYTAPPVTTVAASSATVVPTSSCDGTHCWSAVWLSFDCGE